MGPETHCGVARIPFVRYICGCRPWCSRVVDNLAAACRFRAGIHPYTLSIARIVDRPIEFPPAIDRGIVSIPTRVRLSVSLVATRNTERVPKRLCTKRQDLLLGRRMIYSSPHRGAADADVATERRIYRADTLRAVAGRIRESLGDTVRRLEIAGSIARGEPAAKNLDLVIEPRPLSPDRPDAWCKAFMDRIEGSSRWSVDGAFHAATRTLRLRSRKDPQLVVECFLASHERFGAVQLIRTGPRDFGHALVSLAPKYGHKFSAGGLWRLDAADGLIDMVSTPTEVAVFRALGITWLEPADRTADRLWAADRLRQAVPRPRPAARKPTQPGLFG